MELLSILDGVQNLSDLLLVLDLWRLDRNDVPQKFGKFCELVSQKLNQEVINNISVDYPEHSVVWTFDKTRNCAINCKSYFF